jgi:hypothetical protein
MAARMACMNVSRPRKKITIPMIRVGSTRGNCVPKCRQISQTPIPPRATGIRYPPQPNEPKISRSQTRVNEPGFWDRKLNNVISDTMIRATPMMSSLVSSVRSGSVSGVLA